MTVKANTMGLRLKLGKLSANVQAQVNLALEEAAMRLQGDMVESVLGGKKTGRIYKRGKIVHQASAAGEAPANDTGALATRSISVRKEGGRKLSVYVGVNKGEGLKYARALEFGTAKIAPRPFVRPALEKRRDSIIAGIKRIISQTIEAGGKK